DETLPLLPIPAPATGSTAAADAPPPTAIDCALGLWAFGRQTAAAVEAIAAPLLERHARVQAAGSPPPTPGELLRCPPAGRAEPSRPVPSSRSGVQGLAPRQPARSRLGRHRPGQRVAAWAARRPAIAGPRNGPVPHTGPRLARQHRDRRHLRYRRGA